MEKTDHYCEIEELFLEASIYTTKERHDIFSLMLPDRGWSAKQLWKQLKGKRKADLSTVHRTLTALTEAGILKAALDDKGETIFERVGRDEHHDHLKCETCGTYCCIPCPAPRPTLKRAMRVTTHQILFQGSCPNCT